MRRLILAVLLLVPFAAQARRAPAKRDPARELVDKVQKFYESTKDLHAKFDQEVVSGIGGEKRASGDVWLKKPGRMRWDYAKPEKKLMVADGQTLWVYQPEDEQAFEQDLKSSALPSSVTFLWGAGKLADEFDVTLLQAGQPDAQLAQAGEAALKLVPKKPTAQYRYLIFVVDDKTGLVRQSLVYDQQGGTNHLTFSDVQTNQGVPESKFHFAPPAGTKVIRPH